MKHTRYPYPVEPSAPLTAVRPPGNAKRQARRDELRRQGRKVAPRDDQELKEFGFDDTLPEDPNPRGEGG